MATTDLAPITVRGTEYSDRGYCYEPYYDGPVIHTVYCVRGPEDTGISGHGCIRHDQDGAAIKAARDAKAEERRFTPPEYRTPGGKPPRRKPGPIILAAQGQVVERVALRGRPRTADGTGEWSTWEDYTQIDPDYDGHPMAAHLYKVPKRLSKKEAKAIVKEFTARVPGYEFQIVHAEVRVDETVIA
jgi:hypothetical protein